VVLVRPVRPQAADGGQRRGRGSLGRARRDFGGVVLGLALRRRAAGSAASFSVWHFAGERLVAVDAINAAKDHLLSRKLLDAGVSPTPQQAADPSFDLASLLPKP